ncbi:MAG: recombination factor protein RarA [Acidiferrobacteraceae bacterium]|nr:recombination factor protein RarA [Acidiferrobacteraceae bacterium]
MPILEKQPLAEVVRPQNLEDVIGQEHILGHGMPLRNAILSGYPHSMILWGPPGTGKTTLAKLIGKLTKHSFETLSAVAAGVREIRSIINTAAQEDHGVILFVDEVHRFNKSQQDAFLPYVEDGTITLIGATTENPSFELNNALLSRLHVYKLLPLTEIELGLLFDRVWASTSFIKLRKEITIDDNARAMFVGASDGDARRLLNFMSALAKLFSTSSRPEIVDSEIVSNVIGASSRRFDKGGDYYYELISALHKSVRGTDPDAALYWLARILDGGGDPLYAARRLIRIASEDIGNADPRALTIALNAADAYERLGSPEGELALAQATVFLSCSAKSNAVNKAFNLASKDAVNLGTLDVPIHLRNAPNSLLKELGYGEEYRYPHDEKDGYAVGENYFPDKMKGRRYYEPVDRGLESQIAKKLAEFRAKSRIG